MTRLNQIKPTVCDNVVVLEQRWSFNSQFDDSVWFCRYERAIVIHGSYFVCLSETKIFLQFAQNAPVYTVVETKN